MRQFERCASYSVPYDEYSKTKGVEDIKWNVKAVNVDYKEPYLYGNFSYRDIEVILKSRVYGRNIAPDDLRLISNDIADKLNGANASPEIKKVHFNPPATVVLWKDGTKTVVKAQNDEPFDPEKGLAMAITKKVLGNKGSYYDEIKKWVEPYKEVEKKVAFEIFNLITEWADALNSEPDSSGDEVKDE